MNKTSLITNSLITLGLEENEGKGKGRYFQSRFIEAGIAHYDELGDILITKETIDKFIHTMVGCPVIINHKDVTDKNVDKLRVGVISKVWFNDLDGWYYCEGVLTDQQAIDLIKNQGWNVSCSYNFVSDNQKKMHHGKEIDMEFIDGEFLHLAIVENPRYENANIVVNSKEQVDNGGDGSGNFEHDGRPGEVGGSASEDIKHLSFKDLIQDKAKEIGLDVNIKELDENELDSNKGNLFIDENTSSINIKKDYTVEEFTEKNDGAGEDFFIKGYKPGISDAYHELGHIYYKKHPGILKDFITEANKMNNTDNFEDYAEDISGYSLLGGDRKEQIAKGIEGHELFCEVFSSYYTNGKDFDKYTKLLNTLMNKYENKISNSIRKKENLPMAVLDELKSFILSVVNNEEDKKEEKEVIENEEKEEEKAENKCKNEAEDKKDEAENEEEKEEKEEKEEVIKNKDDEEEKAENEDEEEEKEVENKKVKNSISDMKRIVSGQGTKTQEESLYTSQAERLELGNKY